MTRKSGLIGLALSFLMLLSLGTPAFGADADNGKKLFKNNCASCHSTQMENAMTGPGLYQLMDRVPSREWLYPWIKNSAAVIAEGDDYAVKIYEENGKAVMTPMPHLTDEDIDDILAYVEAYEPATPDTGGVVGNNIADDEQLTSMMSVIKWLVLLVVILLFAIAIGLARLRGVGFLDWVDWDRFNAWMFLSFLILGVFFAIVSSFAYREYYLFTNSASAHGAEIDTLFWVTMSVVYSVFIFTNILLLFFAFRYAKDGKRKATYYPENHKLELLWTVVPAVVLATLVIFGIRTWNTTMMTEASPNAQEIELNAQQFGWTIRYPGKNKKFAKIDRHLISADNILGIDFTTDDARDDFISNDLILPLGREVVLTIRSRDVLHSAYLPHFRVKMDAVPGMPTKFKLTPTISTDSMRTIKNDPEFNYELACTEVCGRGHFSMRKTVIVVEQDSFDTWMSKQPVYYNASLHQQKRPVGNSNGIADRTLSSNEQ